MSTLMIEAATAVTEDQQQSRDGFVWFRPDDDEIQRHRDGLTLDGQGLSPAVLTIAKLIPASSRTAGDAFWVTQTRNVHTATATAYGVITVTDAGDPATRLTGGRLLQRVHLTATSNGVAMQHMNQITERIDRDASTGSVDQFSARLQALLPPGTQPLASFRVGHPVRQAWLSPRRAVDEVAT